MDMRKYLEVISRVNAILDSVEYRPWVMCIIYGVESPMNEAEIRALQVLASRLYKCDPKMFQEFVENVKVYSGKTTDTEQMIFQPNGAFSNEFEGGFFNAIPSMVFEIL